MPKEFKPQKLEIDMDEGSFTPQGRLAYLCELVPELLTFESKHDLFDMFSLLSASNQNEIIRNIENKKNGGEKEILSDVITNIKGYLKFSSTPRGAPSDKTYQKKLTIDYGAQEYASNAAEETIKQATKPKWEK